MSEKENKSSQDTALAIQSNQSNQLQSQVNTNNFSNLSLTEIEKLSVHFRASALYGLSPADQSKCIIKMLAGRELGIGPWTAVKEIYVTQKGTLAFPTSLMCALLIKSNKYDYEIIEDSDKICSIDFFRITDKRKLGNAKFTIEQAEKAGLLKKDTYKSYPEDMLFNRAMARGIRRFCADILCGNLYTPEEMAEIEEKENANKPANNSSVIDVVNEEIKEDSTKKENFIASINKMNQVLVELGEPYIEENLNQLTLGELKLSVDKKSSRMKQLLINQLIKGLPEDQDLVNTLNKESVMNLYKMYRELPKEKSNSEQIIDAQVEVVE